VKVVEAVREAVGDWPVIAKINWTDGIEGGVEGADVVYFASRLVDAGINGLVVSGGCPVAGPRNGAARPVRVGIEGPDGEGYFAAGAARVRAAVGGESEGRVPIFGVGGWRTTAIMEEHVGRSCDAFAICRPLLNDAHLVNRWAEDPGHLTSCVSCNRCLQGEGVVGCRRDA